MSVTTGGGSAAASGNDRASVSAVGSMKRMVVPSGECPDQTATAPRCPPYNSLPRPRTPRDAPEDRRVPAPRLADEVPAGGDHRRNRAGGGGPDARAHVQVRGA